MTLPPDYEQRVYAGWLGKCIGVRFGAPVEGWTYSEIRDYLGVLEEYLPLPEGKLFQPDDDTSLPMLLIRALDDYGPDVTAAQLGETWRNYLGDQRGTLWWGGYGTSTEHTAYVNLAAGIPAPLSGSIALNGARVAEQIGGQIFSDIWGLVNPGNCARAADMAARASSVSHDGNGIYGGMFIAALVSQAFQEADPPRLIAAGLAHIPPDSEYARVVQAVLAFYDENPSDWHAAYHMIAEHFGYDRYPGDVHIIPNAGVVAMALLYGAGDFSRSIQIANMSGWDTDCNVGNVGAIIGVAVGLNGIPARWRDPLNDVLITAGVLGARNLLDIAGCADLFCRLGRRVAGAPEAPVDARYHWNYPGATHGFCQRATGGAVIALRQCALNDGGALRATVRQLGKKGEVRLFVRTYVRPVDLSANYYAASFSPTLYPGQHMRARVYLPPDAPTGLSAALYVLDGNRGETHQGPATQLQLGIWQELSFHIPELHGVCLEEAGVVVRSLDHAWSGFLLLDDFDWAGSPRFSYGWEQERTEYGGASQWTQLRGYWRLQDNAYHGSGSGFNESYSGDPEWRNYTTIARLVPLVGEHHHLNIRVQGALRSYAFGLAPGQQLILYKNNDGYTPVASAAFAWKHGQSYELAMQVEGNHLRAWVTGGPELSWTDPVAPFLRGQIGVSNFTGCHTRFEAIRVH